MFFLDCFTGGTCWLNVNKNGKCTALVQMGSTREDCCGSGILAKSATAAYSEGELSSSSIFIMHIQGGIQCSRCKGELWINLIHILPF